MIEHVAKAIAEAQFGPGAPTHPDDRKAARAAMSAMMDPPEEVVLAGVDAYGECSTAEFEEVAIRCAYRAMIGFMISSAKPGDVEKSRDAILPSTTLGREEVKTSQGSPAASVSDADLTGQQRRAQMEARAGHAPWWMADDDGDGQ